MSAGKLPVIDASADWVVGAGMDDAIQALAAAERGTFWSSAIVKAW